MIPRRPGRGRRSPGRLDAGAGHRRRLFLRRRLDCLPAL